MCRWWNSFSETKNPTGKAVQLCNRSVSFLAKKWPHRIGRDLEQEKTKGRVTLQFRQAIIDARDTAKEFVELLKSKFKDEIHAIEGKREQIAPTLKEIAPAE